MSNDEKELLTKLLKEAQQPKQVAPTKPKRGLTDKIFIAVAIFTVAAFIFSAALMWETKETSGLAYFIPSVAGFGTIVLTAIINKNQKENLNKHCSNVANREEEDNR